MMEGLFMITASEFRNGATFELDGQIFQVVEFQHVKPGKGAAFVRTKMRNIITGSTVERTFNPNDKMPKAHIERKDLQYLYNDGDLYYFMDTETFEQMPISKTTIGDTFKFVKENMTVKILSHKGNVFGIEPPTFVELEVTETEPGYKGDTATGASKPATLETGAIVKVPLFINQGDMIRIDTRTGEYLERA
jgi:elongation factor P